MIKETEEFEKLFNAAVKKYLKDRLITTYNRTSFFAWKFFDRYPRLLNSNEVETGKIIASFLQELDKSFLELHEEKGCD